MRHRNQLKSRQLLFFILLMGLTFHPHLYSQLYLSQSKNLRTVYLGKSTEYLVPHSLRCFENAFRFNQKLYEWTPAEQATLFIQDLRDYGNAAALTVPQNLISLSIAPYSYVFETSPANERINSTINHELVHLVTMDKSSSSDRMFRSFFGKAGPVSENPLSVIYRYLTSPRWSSPRWYIEGIAVFMETWNAGGLGRAQGAYDEMVFRTKVRDNSELYDVLGIEAEGTAVDFQGGAVSYMYGTRFMTYLSYQYGPEKLIQWTSRTEDSDAYFSSQFKRTYGVPLADEWSKWIEWERHWQRANLDSIRKSPVTADRPLSQRPLGSVSRAFYDSAAGKLYAAIRYPGQVATLAAINMKDGSFESLADVKGSTLYYVSSVAYNPTEKIIFFTTDNNDWRDLNSLDVRTGKVKSLLEDIRVGDLAFSQADKSIWGVRHDNGFSTIVRIHYPYSEWNQVYTFPFGKDVFDLDISQDGTLLIAGLTEVSGQQKLILMDAPKLLKDDKSFKVLFDFELSTPSNFVFTPDNKYLFGSSYYTGVSNIYRYTFATNTMEILTNGETGYFRPIPLSTDSMIVFRYTGEGFIPAITGIKPQERVGAIRFLGQEIVEKHPILLQWKLAAPSPANINTDSLEVTTGEYAPFWNIGLASAYPVVEGYKNYPALGWRFNFSDPILIQHMDLTVAYTPDNNLPADERFHATYSHRFWDWTVRANYNGTHFYDLFGPTKTTRRGYSASLQYKKYILYDDPKTFDYTLTLAGYGGLQRLPDFQNVAASFDRFLTLRGVLTYQFFNKSIGAVDDEKGIQWQFISRNNYIQTGLIPRISMNLNYGVALPLDHSSVWLRSSLGYSFGSRDEPFANFYFGGFGNNWVDYQEAKRYREDYSFPGVGLNSFGGTNYAKLLVEWTLPPLRFRSLGTPGLYCNWARLAFFTSTLKTNLYQDVYEQVVYNVGAQLDFRISFLSSFESTLSFGYALAKEENGPSSNEVMVSLKLLK